MANTLRIAALSALAGAGFVLHQVSATADEIGKIGVDWLGNDIVIEAVDDPDVKGVTCHLAYFERGIIDRLQQGNWFEDPSNSAIECRQSGPIEVGEIEQDSNGEEIFKSGRSLIWKKLVVKRLYDRERNMLVYLAHSREVSQGSAKMSISTVKLPDSAVVQ